MQFGSLSLSNLNDHIANSLSSSLRMTSLSWLSSTSYLISVSKSSMVYNISALCLSQILIVFSLPQDARLPLVNSTIYVIWLMCPSNNLKTLHVFTSHTLIDASSEPVIMFPFWSTWMHDTSSLWMLLRVFLCSYRLGSLRMYGHFERAWLLTDWFALEKLKDSLTSLLSASSTST